MAKFDYDTGIIGGGAAGLTVTTGSARCLARNSFPAGYEGAAISFPILRSGRFPCPGQRLTGTGPRSQDYIYAMVLTALSQSIIV